MNTFNLTCYSVNPFFSSKISIAIEVPHPRCVCAIDIQQSALNNTMEVMFRELRMMIYVHLRFCATRDDFQFEVSSYDAEMISEIRNTIFGCGFEIQSQEITTVW